MSKGQTTLDRACEEAVRCKRCIGALRYLWRNSKTKAHDPSVMEMKSYLQASPVQLAHSAAAASQADEDRDDADDNGLEDPSDGSDAGDESQSESGGESIGESGSDAAPDADKDEHDDNDGDDDNSSVYAPTLRMMGKDQPPRIWDPETESPLPNSDGEMPDSQRPGAWMGKFYRDHRKLGESESEKEDSGDVHALTDPDSKSDDDDDDDDEDEPLSTTVFVALSEITTSLGLEDEYLDWINKSNMLLSFVFSQPPA